MESSQYSHCSQNSDANTVEVSQVVLKKMEDMKNRVPRRRRVSWGLTPLILFKILYAI